MEPLLEELQKDARLTDAELAERTGLSVEEAAARRLAWEADGTILGYRTVLDREKTARNDVMAVIEVKLTPERGGGFDRLAGRIARFDQVRACHLMSGGYDLAVFVQGGDLREVARFVSENPASRCGRTRRGACRCARRCGRRRSRAGPGAGWRAGGRCGSCRSSRARR
jgi:DNA-binding Lrp family transcriptional regulator